jgi:hypothetical protein
MGQAKQRGTLEERKNQSISRQKEERGERQRLETERWNALTPEQQEAETSKRARIQNKLRMISMFGWRTFLPY